MLLCALWAQAADDGENSTPTAWWVYTGERYGDVVSTIKTRNARIIDIAADDASFASYTVTYVRNTGSYAKQWWWYVDIDATALAARLAANDARLISLKAYDTGGGAIRFAVAMIANTGADAKTWWYYYGLSPSDIGQLVKANGARLTALQSYTSKGQTLYSAIMIANAGADAKGWWWYSDVAPQRIGKALGSKDVRLLDLTPASKGNFNAVLESCPGGCSGWWWHYGVDVDGVLSKAQDDGARVVTAEPYRGCGAGPCFATVMIANTPADVSACDAQGCISEAKLSAGICGALADRVVGYACLVGAVRPNYGGLARTGANPPSEGMAPDLPMDIAGVSETMTATAILQSLAQDGLTIDARISPYLYSDWQQGPNIGRLTFKDLLSHTSGFGQLPHSVCRSGTTYAALKTIVAEGVSTANVGAPSYGNCNFALLRELMPALQGQPLTRYPDGPQRAKQSSALYVKYMNAHVFQPAGVPVSTCTPSGTSDILSYRYPPRRTPGTDWGDWSGQCGSGGWVLSANDVFDVIDALANGNSLLSTAQKQQMLSECLGWDCAVRPDCPRPYACKSGDLNDGKGTALSTYAAIFKCNVPVVVVVNSPLPPPYQSGDIIGLVADAYELAWVPGRGRVCQP